MTFTPFLVASADLQSGVANDQYQLQRGILLANQLECASVSALISIISLKNHFQIVAGWNYTNNGIFNLYQYEDQKM